MSNINMWGSLTGIRPVKIASKLLNEGKSRSEIIEYFINTYGASREKAELCFNIAEVEKPIMDSMHENGVSVYIGIPFCPTRCLYCSFVTNGAGKTGKYIPEYLNCLSREIDYVGKILKDNGNIVESVYIGGGTPTTLSAEQLRFLFDKIQNGFDLSHIREYTVEAGRPDTITRDKLIAIRDNKIDRISINPQSMNEKTLKIIGRNHTPQDIVDAYNLARECGIENINMDIIAGLPGETFDEFKYTVESVEALSPEDTTVHTMSIKRSSRLHEMLDNYTLTDGAEIRKMVDFAAEYLGKCGKHPYYLYRQKNMLGNFENVGYSKIGYESLYNIYIMEEVQTIISLGGGGVTKIVDRETDRIERIFNVKEPKDYIERIDEMLSRKDVLRKS